MKNFTSLELAISAANSKMETAAVFEYKGSEVKKYLLMNKKEAREVLDNELYDLVHAHFV